MNKLTAKEILEILQKNYTVSAVAYGEWGETEAELTPEQQKEVDDMKASGGYYWQVSQKYILQNLGLGEVEEVKQKGGEGEGDTWYSVKYFKDHDVYIRTDGYYQSHNGADFDEGYGYEVFPKEKTIVVYEG